MAESMHVKTLLPPREVSPLIRTARWGLLAVGIVYGALRLKYLTKREKKIFERDRAIVEKRLKEYNIWFAEQSEKSLQDLAKEAGVSPKN
uniref:ATP synthase F(0) complex subunit e, mitochondrial n=1 Tax=Trichobilharzia regenti TaxID=157069 RepID=A0AA85ITI0_TRIRE|nr:unnamed protein product [Trichobilharzia regenti]